MDSLTPRLAPQQKWPNTIWIVRHGQSAGNVARDLAEAAGHPLIDIMTRDMDTPLSDLGREQARALGHWFREMTDDRRPSAAGRDSCAHGGVRANTRCESEGVIC